jgi:hypothetical protein
MREALFFKRKRVPVEGGCLAHHPAYEVAALGAQQHRDSVGADDCEMLAVAGDEQVGDRRRQCPGRADEDGDRRPAPYLSAPQGDPQAGETSAAKAQRGMVGSIATAPSAFETRWRARA